MNVMRPYPRPRYLQQEKTLLRDPITYIESLAFADGAFKDNFVHRRQL
ncbi:hypothetical protein AYL99_12046 [Fonsecaea erecta]|uniref:Uncharacterized protein n=1 Tax=Fonsecaea erecta TaxID=1367422 RepID=A0A178Z1U1_9EURO|nr:hypothetical protein AYL99_12046 [Fonsecaea erecta]OAP53762.1 hypothetical protein AYL99_12046 [Fonsecaea erecta]